MRIIGNAYPARRLNARWPASTDTRAAAGVKRCTRRSSMTQDGKRVAKYAAVGALIAIPIPIVGPIIGGIVGAVMGHNKNKREARGYY
ncbi:MAG: hypothetical protein AVDCRST_MAG62-1137 [uncultured Sphingomonas sp.]|uniref:Uncharacterized protein n=1 Tax=uncultured Sphingomonas sp. TaxID=158754 RepID=A0A6J4TE89_9SPHN|nr:MAG: hypothetical protein AVDCRST_MAG62-1137 [uncultured Sphingomonas sp.]